MIVLIGAAHPSARAADSPLALHPQNPHYFLFRGKPTVLITSGEHYGAVLNLDFNYVSYLDTLQKDGLNLTRLFTGVYCEQDGAFNIKNNTLSPAAGRLICPWARSDIPGYKLGGNKFDLEKWDAAYFARLKDFLSAAGKRGIVVEIVLFCPFYEDSMWLLSPLHPANNVNTIADVKRNDVYALKVDALTSIQDKMTRKLVEELNGFDNFYFEICNEPYFGGVTPAWQKHIAETIVEAEKALPAKHLIAQNIANKKALIKDPDPHVSIFNFHYAAPPDTIALNAEVNKVFADDETGFKGTADFTYRQEAWNFILAGGAIFDHLDYSFTVGHESGDFALPPKQPGGGGAAFRFQMKVLKDFIHSFDFVKMAPNQAALTSLAILKGADPAGTPGKVQMRVLAEVGRQYAVYIRGATQAQVHIALPAGEFSVEWIDTRTGAVVKAETIKHTGGAIISTSPDYTEDIALKVLLRRAE